MVINENVISGKWNEIKGEIQKSWGKLTGDEVESTKGNVSAIAGLLEQKYGIAKEEASHKLSELYKKFGHSASNKTETVKQGLRENVHEDQEESDSI